MLYVNDDGVIRLTRGDSARLLITINSEIDNNTYKIKPTDTLTFTIKKAIKDTTPSVQKRITGSNQFYILPTDTKDLSFGKYIYDVELTTSDGDVYTIIEPTTFVFLKEVTC